MKWYLGKIKNTAEKVYLEDFQWECGWYWSGGYIGNKNFHAHFDGCFLNVPDYRGHCLGSFYGSKSLVPEYVKTPSILSNGASVWEDLSFFLDDAQYSSKQWWRIKDLFKQFYIYQKAAEAFAYGGHCTSDKRSEAEINPEMAKTLNLHIEKVIIPEIKKALEKI